ncbi:MAG: uracil-DNA glycosylase family protein [Paracoccus sp. (in: a-proteobacteria)]|nr:uracil-DNA glycosylase family protein [Paracoccus sp. (in: a-proteobacteria)]
MPDSLAAEIARCRLCAARFRATASAHEPRPVVWFQPRARILVAGQAPGARVHESGIPFLDASGDRLRDWMGITPEVFYDREKLAILPMAFCFPGYDARGADLPPPPVCAATWRARVLSLLNPRLTLLIGAYAQRWHLGARASVSQTVAGWRVHAPGVFPLPHPSWRNTAWLKRNGWFADELLPALRARIRQVLDDPA